MSGEKRMNTAMNRAIGLGSAHEGVGHWWMQRVSSIALIPLTVLVAPPIASAIGSGPEAAQALFASPFFTIIAVLFVAVSFWHLAQGLQVVIEDYVHESWSRTALLLANTMGCAVLAVGGVYAILKISFAA